MRVGLLVVLLACTPTAAPPSVSAHRTIVPPVRVVIEYDFSGFHTRKLRYTLEWETGAGYRGVGHKVDPHVVTALVDSLTDLRPAEGLLDCSSHYDDYPSFHIVVEGDRSFELSSQSNCRDHIPWTVTERGKHSAQFTGAIGRAVNRMLAEVDPDNWKSGAADEPDATIVTGGGTIGMGEYVDFEQKMEGVSGPGVTACVHSIESSERVRATFGQALHINYLKTSCDLATSRDCRTVSGSAMFDWKGIAANFDFTCVDNQLDAESVSGLIVADLVQFLDSKPARALMRVAAPEKLGLSGDPKQWMLGGASLALPTLTYAPPRRVISVRSVGEHGPTGVAFWAELGFDAAKLTQNPPNIPTLFETVGELDFSGQIVK